MLTYKEHELLKEIQQLQLMMLIHISELHKNHALFEEADINYAKRIFMFTFRLANLIFEKEDIDEIPENITADLRRAESQTPADWGKYYNIHQQIKKLYARMINETKGKKKK